MAAIERLFASGNLAEPSAEDVTRDKALLRMVQREIDEADEANLLDEESMHVFDREPLSDRLMLVSCNACRKPVKASQYLAHAERCRQLTGADGLILELDGGTGHKRPSRKARRKFVPGHENQNGLAEAERSQLVNGDNAKPLDSVMASGNAADSQAVGITSFLRSPKGPKSERPRQTPITEVAGQSDNMAVSHRNCEEYPDAFVSPAKRNKLITFHPFLTPKDLDYMCGVVTPCSTTCCRRALNCKLHSEVMKSNVVGRRQPFEVLIQELNATISHQQFLEAKYKEQHETVILPPLATKSYSFRQYHAMRATLGHLFREDLARTSSSSGTAIDSVTGEHGLQHANTHSSPMDSALSEPHQRQNLSLTKQKMAIQDNKMSHVPGVSVRGAPLLSHTIETGFTSMKSPIIHGSSSSLQEAKLSAAAMQTDIGQSAILRSRVAQTSHFVSISSPGSSLSSLQQSSLGSVHAT